MNYAEKIQNVAEFQPILVTWYTPTYDSCEIKFVCRTQTQLDFVRETLHVKHWEQRLYTIVEEKEE